MIEKHFESQKITQALVTKFQQVFSSFKVDDSHWQKVEELLETAFHQLQVELQKKTEGVLNDSKESYYNIYEDVPVGLFRIMPNGTLLRLNSAMVRILGYPDRDTLLRTSAVRLYGNPKEEDWKVMIETFNLEQETEVCMHRYEGSEVWVQHNSQATHDAEGNVLYYNVAIIDVSAHKRSETQIREAMKEKEVLLKEIHHRVKNNLQIVSSLLNLQSNYLRDAYDRELFKQSQNRIKAMALLHEKLYRSAEITRIDFDEYLNSLMPSLFQSYKTSLAVIECTVEKNNILLDIDTAIPCGLIVSELVANSLKHAFPDGRVGKINVALSRFDRHTFQLSVCDDGVGMDQNTPSASPGAPMGWELVRTLTEQLGGTIEINKLHGMQVHIIFKEKVQK